MSTLAAETYEQLAREPVRHRAATIESVCARALLSGHYGVLVDEDAETVSLSSEVPFMEIHYFSERHVIVGDDQ